MIVTSLRHIDHQVAMTTAFLMCSERTGYKMDKRDSKQIMREFRLRQGRQIFVIAAPLFLVLFLAVLYKRPDRFGEFSDNTLFAAQFVLITAFIGFTVFNWRCPSCNKFLGNDINRRICKQCGTRLR